MDREEITIAQGCEALNLLRRLTPEQYQARRSLIGKITDPDFNLTKFERGVITPITYGEVIEPPFRGAILDDDGPGDEVLIAGISHLRLVPILGKGDPIHIQMEEAVQRGRADPALNWGQRAIFGLRDAGNDGKISTKVWPVGQRVVGSKTSWMREGGYRVAWFVLRYDRGFLCNYEWFDSQIGPSCLPSLA